MLSPPRRVDEGLAVALRAGQSGRREPPHRQTGLLGRRAPARRASRRAEASRTTPPLPTRSGPSSNWGLTIASSSPSSSRQRATAGSTLASEMNETSTVARRGENGSWRGRGPRVDALDHRHPLVVAKPPVELAVRDVERDHPRRAALEQAVGEAAGGGADVEAVAGRRRRSRARRARSPSFSPPRETYRGGSMTTRSASGAISWLGLLAIGPSCPMRTRPARTDSAALVREPASPRSASRASIRRFGMRGRYRCDPKTARSRG